MVRTDIATGIDYTGRRQGTGGLARLDCRPTKEVNRLRALPLALLVLIALFGERASSEPQPPPGADAGQLVLVTTMSWDAYQGVMRTFTRQGDKWKLVAPATAVAIGRKGSAWGIGLHDVQPGPQKQEGDGRSPAGMFRIGEAFGYAPSIQTKLPYSAMTEWNYCMDVSASEHYNRIVDARKVGGVAVIGSTEPMRRDLHGNADQLYKIGFVIEHNASGTPDAGSCIFAHLWRTPGAPTAGCTAMAEAAMLGLVQWLDSASRPIFVLLPREEYARLKGSWRLPDLE